MPQRLPAILAAAALALALAGAVAVPAAIAAPVVALTAPLNNVRLLPPASIVLGATASDSAAAIARVEFYNGAALLGSASAAPYTFTWNNVASGVYSLSAKAISSVGKVNSGKEHTGYVVQTGCNARRDECRVASHTSEKQRRRAPVCAA